MLEYSNDLYMVTFVKLAMLRITHFDSSRFNAWVSYKITPTIQSDLTCSARPGSRSVQNLGNQVLEDERLSWLPRQLQL
jgi:hypothetical protein